MRQESERPVQPIPRASRVFVVGALLLLAGPVLASGQVVRGGVDRARGPRVAEADRLHFDGRPAEALEVYRDLLRSRGDRFDVLWRAAREAVVLGILSPTWEQQIRWYREAEAYARRAVALRPRDPTALYWLGAALGRRALQVGPRETVSTAREVHRIATRLLRLDPDHAGAHHLLGKLNAEVMHLPTVKRLLAKILAGSDIRRTSWEQAEEHLRRAVELDPEMILYHLDLGGMYVWRGRWAEARRELEAAVSLQPRHPPDPLFQRRARALLEALPAG